MREIIFRGKRVDNGEWVYGNYAFTDNDGKQHFIFQNNAFEYAVIPQTVGQYTGLTDKNGKKIFEGDVVRYIAQKSGRTILYDVEWQEEMSRFEMKTINDGIKIHEWLERSKANYCYEVIGNIHDNPELIGGEGNA